MKRIFISSVQREFAEIRILLKRYLSRNPAYRRLFSTFVFEEDVVSMDRRTDEVYLNELRNCDIYLGLIGNEYGYEDSEGVSPTEREFDEATRLGLPRLLFVLGNDNAHRHPKETAFLSKISAELIRCTYEIPRSVIAEAVINAIAHRDYASTGSVQVEVFSDRVVVRNPGHINPAITKEELFVEHSSYPNNPKIADQLYQTKHIEKFGTGFTDLVADCRAAGLLDPVVDDSRTEFTITIFRRTNMMKKMEIRM